MKVGWSATTVYDVLDKRGGSRAEEMANGEDT